MKLIFVSVIGIKYDLIMFFFNFNYKRLNRLRKFETATLNFIDQRIIWIQICQDSFIGFKYPAETEIL